jgi:hypothetical protein
MYQPEALGISAELREQGYALMCVGFPTSGTFVMVAVVVVVVAPEHGLRLGVRVVNRGGGGGGGCRRTTGGFEPWCVVTR